VATQSVGIDVIARSEDTGNMPEAQKRALAILIQHVRSMFPDIPNTVSTPNTYYVGADGTSYEHLPGGLPPKGALKYSLVRKAGTSLYTIADVKKNHWGICRHRDFWKKACPVLVPLEEIVAMQINTGNLQIQQLDAAKQAELEALAKAAGVL
jgi:ribulose-5-phosphate 4-epimerase/fuculose-1-phosphate aldolase